MNTIFLNSNLSMCDLLSRTDFLAVLKHDVAWVLFNADLGTISNLRSAFPSYFLNGVMNAKMTSLPMCENIDPPIDAVVVPAVEGVVEAIAKRFVELQRIAKNKTICIEDIGENGISISDPAGLGSDGKARWAFMVEDELYGFFPRDEQEKEYYEKELSRLGIDFQSVEPGSYDFDTNWISRIRSVEVSTRSAPAP